MQPALRITTVPAVKIASSRRCGWPALAIHRAQSVGHSSSQMPIGRSSRMSCASASARRSSRGGPAGRAGCGVSGRSADASILLSLADPAQPQCATRARAPSRASARPRRARRPADRHRAPDPPRAAVRGRSGAGRAARRDRAAPGLGARSRKPSLVSRIAARRARAICDSGARYSSTQLLSCCAAPDAAAQLVQLRQSHALGILDDHQTGIGHVDADLDHRGGHQQLDLAGDEALHDLFFLLRTPCARAAARRASAGKASASACAVSSAAWRRAPRIPRSAGRPSRPGGRRGRPASMRATTWARLLFGQHHGARPACGRAAAHR